MPLQEAEIERAAVAGRDREDLGLVGAAQPQAGMQEVLDVAGNIRKGKDAKELSPIAFEAVKCIDALFEIEVI